MIQRTAIWSQPKRRGLSLIELLIATAITTMVVGSLGAMSLAIQQGAEHSEGQATVAQHARIVLDHIARTVEGASATFDCPGVFVIEEQSGSWKFPATLLVWQTTRAVSVGDRPRMNELVIFCANPAAPSELVELRAAASDSRVLATTNSGMRSQVQSLWASASARQEVVVLTNLVRATTISGAARSGMFFQVNMTPSDTTGDWNSLAWPQGMHSSTQGLRQVQVLTELQLQPRSVWAKATISAPAIPFFGSATFRYQLRKEDRP